MAILLNRLDPDIVFSKFSGGKRRFCSFWRFASGNLWGLIQAPPAVCREYARSDEQRSHPDIRNESQKVLVVTAIIEDDDT
jgi:hypothetical protein